MAPRRAGGRAGVEQSRGRVLSEGGAEDGRSAGGCRRRAAGGPRAGIQRRPMRAAPRAGAPRRRSGARQCWWLARMPMAIHVGGARAGKRPRHQRRGAAMGRRAAEDARKRAPGGDDGPTRIALDPAPRLAVDAQWGGSWMLVERAGAVNTPGAAENGTLLIARPSRAWIMGAAVAGGVATSAVRPWVDRRMAQCRPAAWGGDRGWVVEDLRQRRVGGDHLGDALGSSGGLSARFLLRRRCLGDARVAGMAGAADGVTICETCTQTSARR